MADKVTVANVSVAKLVEELKNNGSSRFSKADYQTLVFGILSDPNFKVKKYLIKNGDLITEDYDCNAAFCKFMDKLLKHAGISDPSERTNVIESFEYSPKDVEWVSEAVDEALSTYADCNKNVRLFRDKMLQLTIRKMVRSGKYAGMTTFKKSVLDRQAELAKAKK